MLYGCPTLLRFVDTANSSLKSVSRRHGPPSGAEGQASAPAGQHVTSPGFANGTAYLVLKKQLAAVGFQMENAHASRVCGCLSSGSWQRVQQSSAVQGFRLAGPCVQLVPTPIQPVLRRKTVPGGGSRASNPSYQ